MDLDHLESWVGRSETDSDRIDPRRVAQIAGTLGWPNPPAAGEPLPLPWHWLFFTPVIQRNETGEDGHPARGGFLPPVPLQRRMWASSEVECRGSLGVGAAVHRRSEVTKVEVKQGKAGTLVFVTVEHQLSADDGDPVITERQHLVYRNPGPAQARGTDAKTDPDLPSLEPLWEHAVEADTVLLFRYSALMFNAHRIHYDRRYAVETEGYPGLVVQGPLIASLLLKLAYDQLGFVELKKFSFRARRPLFDGSTMLLRGARDGDRVTLWALTPEGQLATRLDVELA